MGVAEGIRLVGGKQKGKQEGVVEDVGLVG